MNRNHLLFLLLGLASFLAAVQVPAQGSLTPPGAPAPTMRSLDQIYAEITKLTPASPLLLTSLLSPTQQGVIHMTAKGQKQGAINGECTIKGLENTIVCLGFTHEIASPRDAVTGLPTGKRQHKPLTITKNIDRTTPLFYSALVGNENLPEVIFNFFQTDSKNQTTNQYRIKLTNAMLADIRSNDPSQEILQFTYQKIQWTHVPSGINAMDDWEVAAP
jgi:type VI secretion system secreted protein Hcp